MKKLSLVLVTAVAVYLLGVAAMAFLRWNDHWFLPLTMALLLASVAVRGFRALDA